jgi:hypothetical protein
VLGAWFDWIPGTKKDVRGRLFLLDWWAGVI